MSLLDNAQATSVYGVSVDSRSRPSSQPDNKYDVDLGRTLDRVKSIQLGSIQIPDCRYAFDSRSQLEYSEPITIPPDSHVFIEQTVVSTNRATCVTTTRASTVQILVPPTLNKIVGYVPALAPNDADVVTTEHDTGLTFGARYYPLVGLALSVVGAHFPQSLMPAGGAPAMAPFPAGSGPVLVPSTLTPTSPGGTTYYGPPSGPPDSAYVYALGYLNRLTTSAGNYDARHLLPNVATSYVSAPRPTLVELFVMLNAALNDALTAPNAAGVVLNATATTPVVVTTAAAHDLHNYDQVTVEGVVGVGGANGTFFVTVLDALTFSLNLSVGTGGPYVGGGAFTCVRALETRVQFGFDDTNNTIVATGASRVTSETRAETRSVSLRFVNPPPGARSLSSYLGFGVSRLDPPARATVPSFIIRTVEIRRGNYTAAELVAMMNTRMNPLLFTDADPATRTVSVLLPGGGAPSSLVLPFGRYTGVQLAAYLNFYLSQPFAQIDVTFDDASGRFTFAQVRGLAFTLVFGAAAAAQTALRLGFEPVNYSGASRYTSVRRAVYGVTSSNAYPSNTYVLSGDPTQHHFTFDTGDALRFKSTAGTNTPDVAATWAPVAECSDVAAGLALTFVADDLLFAQAPFATGPVAAASPTSPVVITTAAAHGLASGDNVTVTCVGGVTGANGTWLVLVLTPTTFALDTSAGTGTYVAGTGTYYTNSFGGVATNTYGVVVSQAWDASGGLGLPQGSAPAQLTLAPTVSIFSALGAGTVDAALGVPTGTTPVYLQDAARSVFQLMLGHPDSRACNFGFPPIAWPPSSFAGQLFDTRAFPTYSPATGSVPVASSYTSPYCYNLLAPDYIIMLLCNPTGSKDAQTHKFGTTTRPFFAKLYLTAPYLQISEQMLHSTFAGFQRVNSVSVEFQNPDGTLVEFNGRPHSFSLLFTLYENTSETTCF
jgi:hypothetical protein